MPDYSHDRIGDRLAGRDLTPQERLLAADDHVRVAWVIDAVTQAATSARLPIIDVGASDGAITRRLLDAGLTVRAIERHPAHQAARAALPCWTFGGDAFDGLAQLDWGRQHVVLLGEILEHWPMDRGAECLLSLQAEALVITVPNAQCASFRAAGRDRADYPDHRRQFAADDLASLLHWSGWTADVVPIVGTREDSIWLGAVARRG